MAGQSQAANLGGILSQIAGTLGTSVDAEPYVTGVENTFRPNADPENVDQMRNLMEWQQRMGRTDAARNTMVSIRDLEERQKEEKLRREGQARSAAVAEYQRAYASGDAEKIAAAEDALLKVGEAQCVDVTGLLAGVEQRAFAQLQAGYAADANQQRIDAENRRKKAAEMTGDLQNKLASANDFDKIDELEQNADPSIAVAAAQLATSARSRLQGQIDRREAEAVAKAPMRTYELNLPETGIPENLRAGLQRKTEQLNKDIEALNKKLDGGVLVPGPQKKALADRRAELERTANGLTDRLVIAEFDREYREEQERAETIQRLELSRRAPLDQAGVMGLAQSLAGYDEDTGKPNPILPEHIGLARDNLRQSRNLAIDEQLAYLRDPEAEYEGHPADDYTTPEPEKEEEVSLWNRSIATEGDRRYLEGVRSKITPLGSGKYTWKGEL